LKGIYEEKNEITAKEKVDSSNYIKILSIEGKQAKRRLLLG